MRDSIGDWRQRYVSLVESLLHTKKTLTHHPISPFDEVAGTSDHATHSRYRDERLWMQRQLDNLSGSLVETVGQYVVAQILTPSEQGSSMRNRFQDYKRLYLLHLRDGTMLTGAIIDVEGDKEYLAVDKGNGIILKFHRSDVLRVEPAESVGE